MKWTAIIRKGKWYFWITGASVCRSISTSSSYVRLGLIKGLYPVCLLVKILRVLLPSFILAAWPAHLNHLDLITVIILDKWFKLWNSPLWSLLYSPLSCLLSPNTRLRILFSNSLSLDSFLNVRDHVSQPYSTTDVAIKTNCFRAQQPIGDRGLPSYRWFDANFLQIEVNDLEIRLVVTNGQHVKSPSRY